MQCFVSFVLTLGQVFRNSGGRHCSADQEKADEPAPKPATKAPPPAFVEDARFPRKPMSPQKQFCYVNTSCHMLPVSSAGGTRDMPKDARGRKGANESQSQTRPATKT